MLSDDFELTEFSNNNFAIIGRILYITTKYEKTFRTYFSIVVCKWLPYFIKNVPEFSRIGKIGNSELALKKVYEISNALSFNRVICIFFDTIINRIALSNKIKEKFINAKNARNFVAHELCVFDLNEIETTVFRIYLQEKMSKIIRQIIECTLIMEYMINKINMEPDLIDFNKKVDKIFFWTITILD